MIPASNEGTLLQLIVSVLPDEETGTDAATAASEGREMPASACVPAHSLAKRDGIGGGGSGGGGWDMEWDWNGLTFLGHENTLPFLIAKSRMNLLHRKG